MSKKELQMIKNQIVKMLRIRDMNPDEITKELGERVREALFHLIDENKIEVTRDWRARLRKEEEKKG